MILTLIEHVDGRPDRLSLEALTLARKLAAATGEPLHTVSFGADAREAATQLGGGVAVAHVVEDDRLSAFAPVAWAATASQAFAHPSCSRPAATAATR